MEQRGRVILVDDEAAVRQTTAQWLELAGFVVTQFGHAADALAALQPDFDGILVTDVRMPQMDGQQLLLAALQQVPELPVILVTGHGSVDMAIAAMREGAYDFIEKPFDPERLVETLHRACEKRRLTLENQRLLQRLHDNVSIEDRLIGLSPAMERLRREVLRLARLDTNLIIYGETGTGKELVAQCLHEFGPRADQPFVALNCGAIPESLFESELFGYEAGAFTGASKRRVGKFEFADGGTLFMDEIESMPLNLQVKVLRTLEQGSIERLGDNRSRSLNLRVVAATKTELKGDEGFRQDLYYRLNLGQLYIPPLRERTEDIPLLFEYYARQGAQQQQRDYQPCSAQEMRTLQHYAWPGNVRELRNIALRFGMDPQCNLTELLQPAAPEYTETELADLPLSLQVQNFEAQVIRQTLQRYHGNVQQVLQILDLPRRTLNQKMQKYGINRSDFL
ncbi:sigma-54 dependent transcriptional regulator [Neptuniibacter sp. CAU 1671]|nr:sigma-54 dependent transcriptional regulator [Neptuniibacter sp. CAU 1671]MDF2181703.1 sigma-54 dependent transcriptional regulator [Neptuniibacter sp. CAU 1671]